jgi:hypothetical protein
MVQSTPRIRSLLRQADRVAGSGKRYAAEQLYRQILEEAPETAQAWAGLSAVTRDASEKERALRRAAELDPQYKDGTGPSLSPQEEAEPESQVVAEPEQPAVEVRPPAGGGAEPAISTVTIGDASAVDPALRVPDDGEVLAERLFCDNHPTRATNLRCNRCGRPICSSCARPTPVGYRCPVCIREQEDAFYSARIIDYLIAALVALPLALVAGYIAARIGFFVIFLSALAGTLIGRAVHFTVGRRRGRWLPAVVAGAVIIGGALPAVPLLLAILFGQPFGAIGLLWLGIYIVGATGAAYYQLK